MIMPYGYCPRVSYSISLAWSGRYNDNAEKKILVYTTPLKTVNSNEKAIKNSSNKSSKEAIEVSRF